MPPNHFESEVESFLEGSHGDRTHIKRADHHTVTPLCGTLLLPEGYIATHGTVAPAFGQPGGAIQLQIWQRDKVTGDLIELPLEKWEKEGIITYDYQKYPTKE